MNPNELHKKFNKTLRDLSRSKWQIDAFRDFLTMAHISIANTVYGSEELEKEYMDIAKQYNEEELQKFAELLGITTMALSEKNQDFLGESFMQNDMGNNYREQFFTPYHICKMMAQITMPMDDDIKGAIKKKGWFSMYEPTCGASAMIIAADEVIKQTGLKTSELMWAQVQDIDHICFMMSYIQLSLLDIPARVVLGNSLANEEIKVLYTPAFIRENWMEKIEAKEEELEAANNQLYNDELLERFSRGVLF